MKKKKIKNLKQTESHLSDIRNKLQLTKEENIKLNILLKREVGDSFDLNRALTDKNYFKPRAEIIEGLKAKIKQLEKVIQVNNIQNQSNSQNPNNSNNASMTGLNLPLIPTSANMIPYSQYRKESWCIRGRGCRRSRPPCPARRWSRHT